MTDKKVKGNIHSGVHEMDQDYVGDELKRRIGASLPDGLDISSIGNIDLFEAEKIATEEIVFLTEEDLIEGLEDFELIPIKNDIFNDGEYETDKNSSSKLRINEISSEEKILPERDELPADKTEVSEESENDIFEKKSADFFIEDEPFEAAEADSLTEDYDSLEITEEVEISETAEAPVLSEESEPVLNAADEIPSVYKESAVEVESEGNEKISEDDGDSPVQVSGRITENSINIQFEEIFSEADVEEENIPARFDDDRIGESVRFIDDINVSPQNKTLQGYSEDPLTERLSRIIHVSDSPMSVITAKSDYYDDHAYVLEDTTLYEKNAAAAENEEIFFDDPELDFFEHAIIKNDFSRFIQEIDDYYDITRIESESEISQILGLNSEEREVISNDLFSDYYSNIDFDSEIDFLNPDLDFINRSYAESKDVSYLLDNPDSLLDEVKLSIEDDITARSAIVFEEDVEDLKLLMERDYGTTARERVEHDILSESEPDYSGEKADEVLSEHEAEDQVEELSETGPVLIDITDQVIILEDKDNVDAFTSRFPDKKEDLARLLSYLDGLFEKLPEEAVKKFAQSEYFDLYVKVMNEIGA